MEDIKKENQELKNNFYMETSHLLDAHLRDAIWSWIEQKIKEAKDEGFQAGCDFVSEQYKEGK